MLTCAAFPASTIHFYIIILTLRCRTTHAIWSTLCRFQKSFWNGFRRLRFQWIRRYWFRFDSSEWLSWFWWNVITFVTVEKRVKWKLGLAYRRWLELQQPPVWVTYRSAKRSSSRSSGSVIFAMILDVENEMKGRCGSARKENVTRNLTSSRARRWIHWRSVFLQSATIAGGARWQINKSECNQ